jgi:hypothetical protein
MNNQELDTKPLQAESAQALFSSRILFFLWSGYRLLQRLSSQMQLPRIRMNMAPVSQNSISPVLALSALAMFLAFTPTARASGPWTNTGSLNTSRKTCTSTVLLSGKVLVAGGHNDSGHLASAELYDPVAGTWAPTGAMNVARMNHSATLLPDGRVLVVGGANTAYLASAELYNPVTGTWTTTSSVATPNAYHTATMLPNGKVLVAGGIGAGIDDYAQLYDPSTGNWAATGSLSRPRGNHRAVLLPGGRVLIVGGQNYDGYLSAAEIYDSANGLWTDAGTITTPRAFFNAVLLKSGNVLIVGGVGTGGAVLSSTEQYNPASNTWTVSASLKDARKNHVTGVFANGTVLVAGGNDDSVNALSTTELYNPTSGTWMVSGVLNSARYASTATVLNTGHMLVAGGYRGNETLSSAELYTSGPYITAQPQANIGYWGQSVTMSVTAAGGTQPYTYQWLKDGVAISGATNSTLDLTNLQISDTGAYSVTVGDADNSSITSASAPLVVNPAGVSVEMHAAVKIDGVVGQIYGIQATTELANSNSWIGVANVTLTQPTQIWYDPNSTTEQPRRFYRVVPGPISIP